MRILILGASGMLGHMACRVFSRSHDITAACRSHWNRASVLRDILQPDKVVTDFDVLRHGALVDLLQRVRPAVVLNCAGLIKQKKEALNERITIRANGLFPHLLAAACDEVGAKMIHLSTDCIFSGERGNYSEDDTPDPVDLYGRSKLLGEVNRVPHLTVRTSVIGWQLAGQEGLMEWFHSQSGGSIRGFARAIYTGLTTRALCQVLERVVTEHPDLSCLINIAAEPISKFDLLASMKVAIGTDTEIIRDEKMICDRSLDARRFLTETGIEIPGWSQMISDLAEDRPWYDARRRLGDDVVRITMPTPSYSVEKPNQLMSPMTSAFDGKNIVVTGGTGSLGKVLVRRLMSGRHGMPQKVIVFSRDEGKHHDMRLAFDHIAASSEDLIYKDYRKILQFRIGDVRDPAAVHSVLRGTDILFNAAALKQVPNCEYFPGEAVNTNIRGAINIAQCINNFGLPVEAVIGISTDKACHPVNVMGMSKAIQERVFISANIQCSGTRFMCARYGNVLASRGSVIPLFHHQIRSGGPVTLTTRDMTRFLLTLEQAVDVLAAVYVHGERGETFIPRVPSARIEMLADCLIGDRDIEVAEVGIRSGEKVHEILIAEDEAYRTIEKGGYYVILAALPELRNGDVVDPVITHEYSSRDDLMDRDELAALLFRNRLLVENDPDFTGISAERLVKHEGTVANRT